MFFIEFVDIVLLDSGDVGNFNFGLFLANIINDAFFVFAMK